MTARGSARQTQTFQTRDPAAFDREGMRRYLRAKGCSNRHVRDVLSRIARAIRMIGAARFFWLNPHAGEISAELQDSAAYRKLGRVLRWQLLQAVREYERFIASAQAPSPLWLAERLAELEACGPGAPAPAVATPTPRRGGDRAWAGAGEPATGLDKEGFRAYLRAAGLSAKNADDNVARADRARRLLEPEEFQRRIAGDLDTAVACLTRRARQAGVAEAVRAQVARALTYYMFFHHGWSAEDPRFPAQRARRGAGKGGADGFDRDGFRAYLSRRGEAGKRLSDRVTRVARVARLVGSDTFEQAGRHPVHVRDRLLRAAERAGIKADIQGQLLRAYRDYVHYLYARAGAPLPDPVAAALARGPAARQGGRRVPSGKAAARGTAPSRDGTAGTCRGTRPADGRGHPPGENGRLRRGTAQGHDRSRRRTKAADEARRQAEIEAFLNRHGATRCRTEIADGAIPLETLGLD